MTNPTPQSLPTFKLGCCGHTVRRWADVEAPCSECGAGYIGPIQVEATHWPDPPPDVETFPDRKVPCSECGGQEGGCEDCDFTGEHVVDGLVDGLEQALYRALLPRWLEHNEPSPHQPLLDVDREDGFIIIRTDTSLAPYLARALVLLERRELQELARRLRASIEPEARALTTEELEGWPGK